MIAKSVARVFGVWALAVAFAAFGAEVDEATARTAIGNWRTRNGTFGLRMGERVQEVRRVSGQGVRFHVVRFEGGGVAIASADTKSRPVIMFSDSEDFDENPDNPAWDILKATLHTSSTGSVKMASAPNAAAPLTANEREWAELAAPVSGVKYRTDSVYDVRVDSLVKARWGQREAGGDYCYNYYTPYHWPCGCVATALAQIVRAFEFPSETTYIEPYEGKYCKVNGAQETRTTQGGYYEWSKMPYQPDYRMTPAQRQAIGKLTSDLGIYLAMRYGSGGSGSWTFMSKWVLTTKLGYSSAMAAINVHSHGVGDDFQRMLISNFDAKKPVQLDLSDHSILGDGYGYDKGGNLWYHLNFGWSGAYWYQPPTAETKAEGYSEFEGGVYNIFTTESAKCVIASGRVTDEDGSPVAGKTVSAAKKSAPNQVVATATTDAHGIYAVFVEPGEYVISTRFERADRHGEKFGSVTANARKCVSSEFYPDTPGTYYTPPYPSLGNAAFCDIQLETEYYPSTMVSIQPSIDKGRDFATATVPVEAQIEFWSEKMTKPAVVEVVLTSVYGGAKQTRTYEIPVGNTAKHTFKPEFDGLVVGERYTVTADIRVDGGSESSAATQTSAAREFTWFSETAATFPNSVKWSYGSGEAQVQDGLIQIWTKDGSEGVRYAPPPPANAYASREILIRGTLNGCYPTEEELSTVAEDARAAISMLMEEKNASGAEVVVYGNGMWNRTGVRIALETECEILISLDETAHALTYRLRPEGGAWTKLGEYALTASTAAPSISFVGSLDIRSLDGDLVDANFVADESGKEYPTLAAAIADGATGVLTPLWKSTWGFPSVPGMFTVKDPNGYVTYTGSDNMLRSETLSDGSTRYWCAQLDLEAKAQALSYMRTTVDLGLVKTIITDKSTVKIGDYLVSGGKMSFSVQVDDEEVAKAAVLNLVEVSGDLADKDGWDSAVSRSDALNITFEDGKVVVTPMPQTMPKNGGVHSLFLRVRIPKID